MGAFTQYAAPAGQSMAAGEFPGACACSLPPSPDHIERLNPLSVRRPTSCNVNAGICPSNSSCLVAPIQAHWHSRAVIFCGFLPPERRAEEFFQANLAFKAKTVGVL